jgi:hypothetical protein
MFIVSWMTSAREKIKYFIKYPRLDLFEWQQLCTAKDLYPEEYHGHCALLCSW